MANKRDSSSQKRQRVNRAQRDALAARTSAASTPRPSRQPPKAVRRTGGEAKERRVDADTPSDATKTGKGATAGARPKRERRPRLGDSPVDLDTLEGSWFKKVVTVPGGAQVLVGFGITVVTAVFLSQQKLFSAAGTPGSVKKPKLTRTLFDVIGTPKGLLVLGVPVVVALFALLATLRPWRRRAWTGSALVFGALVLIGGALFFNFIFSAGLIAFALFRASKVEGRPPPLFASRRKRGEPVGAEDSDDFEAEDADPDDDFEDADGDDGDDPDEQFDKKRFGRS